MTLLMPLGIPPQFQAAFSTFFIDATTDFLAFSILPQGTTAIAKIQFHIDTETGVPGTMGMVLTADNNNAPTVSVGVPTDIGGGSPTLKSIVPADIVVGANTITFTNAFTPTEGTRYWIVFYPISGTWDATNRYRFVVSSLDIIASFAESRAFSTDTGTSWTLIEEVLQFVSVLDAGDNYLPTINCACIGSTTQSISYSDASNPDEYANIVTLPANVTVALHGLSRALDISSTTTSDHSLHAFTDPFGTPVELEAITIDISAYRPSLVLATVIDRFINGPYTITGGTVVAVSAKATSTGTILVVQHIFASQGAKEACLLVRDMYGATRNGGTGVFTAALDRVYSFLPWLELLGTAGGGGGPLVGPGRLVRA